jgi:hypothetical protein
MGDFSKKNFLQIFLLNKVYFSNFANRYIKHFLVTSVFDLQTYILVSVLRIPQITHAEKNGKDPSKRVPKIKI